MPAPDTYRHWQTAARGLLEPLAALMRPGRADLPIQGRPSDHDAAADRLESFARPLLLAAFYLQSEPEPAPDLTAAAQPPAAGPRPLTAAGGHAFRVAIAQWFRAGLANGTDPASPHYWGPDASYHQHHVEMGLMAIALQIADRDLWAPLGVEEKARVARWFGTSRGSGIVNNNHLFMSVHILEFLDREGHGRPSDRAVITAHLNQLETMHRGGGWFEDGINQAFDHYNAYAFHFYGLMWARLHGAREPARAQRWREWARLFVDDYQHFFAASGEHPAFGRSITYRFNGLNVFGLALAEGCTDLPPGRLRRLCTRNLDFFLRRPIYQEQGCLSAGFTDRFDAIVEPYSAPASPYWAAKGFAPLLLPPDHGFWRDPEEPLPVEQPAGFVRVLSAPGLVIRSLPAGEVEILNGGSMVGQTQVRYGPWKWSKLSYRTGVHFTYAFPEISNVSLDCALTQELDDGRRFGRHSTVVVEMDAHHLGYVYNLGSKIGQVNTRVETFVFWRAGWLLQVHQVQPEQPAIFRVGGFALPLAAAEVRLAVSPSPAGSKGSGTAVLRYLTPGGRGTVLQCLTGSSETEWDARLDDTTERRHVAAPYHVTPVARTMKVPAGGSLQIVALTWAGAETAAASPWHVKSGRAGAWQLSHPLHGAWSITHAALPELDTRL